MSQAVDQALTEFRGRISKHSLVQIDQAAKSGVRHVLGVMAGAAIFNNGRFDDRDVDALYPSSANAANFKATLEDLAARHVLLEAHDDEFGRGYRFSEEAVLPYLWILAAQQRFLEGRKAASAATDKPAVPTTDKAAAAAEKPTEKAGPAAVATPRAAGRP